MATSSITHNFVITDPEAIERFANAVEESYQESLVAKPKKDYKITLVRDHDEFVRFMERRERIQDAKSTSL